MDGARDQPLWRPAPERAAETNLARFAAEAGKRWNKSFSGMADLHRWSISAPEEFWRSVWDWGGVIAKTPGKAVLIDGDKMPGAQFFLEARLNFAENL
ncbi:MAG TPA: acetyl-coenzyme A synthetase N-terminal domain-containing protein, partial [Stellaceae bacterium]|nr:acetyl-coenzyme A synthetase N-terminal domain-containing protein [Stellaceae bacterium]